MPDPQKNNSSKGPFVLALSSGTTPTLTIDPYFKHVTFSEVDQVSLIEVQPGDEMYLSDSNEFSCTQTFCWNDPCTFPAWFSWIKSRIPCVKWLPKYPLKKFLYGDVISGLTVAIMHIPQGLAYAHLGSVPPVVGIYMAIYPVIVYFIFGTSRHISLGSLSIVCLMTGQIVETNSKSETLNSNETYVGPIEVMTAVTFVVGISELFMYFLHFDMVCSLLSKTFVSSFTTGAAVHVFASQVKEIFGLKIKTEYGPLMIFNTFSNACENVGNSNWIAALLFIFTAVVICLSNIFLKPRLMQRYNLVPPVELIVIILGTIISSLLNLPEGHDVPSVGDVPLGLPMPRLPNLSLLHIVAIDSVIVMCVAYFITMSMAFTFSNKLSYHVDPHQELLAQGLANFTGSCFYCLPVASSLSRSLIQEATGGQTQVVSLISCSCLLFVLLFMGPLMNSLPRSVLAGVIVMSLGGMFLQVRQVKVMWTLSQLDACMWVATFLSVVIIDIKYGLAFGIAFGLITVFLHSMQPYLCLLGRLPLQTKVEDHRVYIYVKLRHEIATEVPGVKIIQLVGPLNYATSHHIKKKIIEFSGVNPIDVIKVGNAMDGLENKYLEKQDEMMTVVFKLGNPVTHNLYTTTITRKRLTHIILDFTLATKFDYTGLLSIRSLIKLYGEVGVEVIIVSPKSTVSHVRTIEMAVAYIGAPDHDGGIFSPGSEEDVD